MIDLSKPGALQPAEAKTVAQAVYCCPEVAGMVDRAQPDVLRVEAAGAGVAQAACCSPGVAEIVRSTKAVVLQIDAAEGRPRFYFGELDSAYSAPAGFSDAGANAGPAVGAARKGARSATPVTPWMPQVAHSGEW